MIKNSLFRKYFKTCGNALPLQPANAIVQLNKANRLDKSIFRLSRASLAVNTIELVRQLSGVTLKKHLHIMKPRLESLGAYTPEKSVSTSELVSQLKDPPVFDLEEITGIRERRFRSESEDSFSLAMNSVEDCLKKSKYEASDMEAVIYSSITRFKGYPKYQYEPAMSLFIKNAVGAENALNFDVSNACAGMTTGVYALYNLLKAGVIKKGMVLSGECITPISETAVKEVKDPFDEQFASLTVGDSGCALIMDNEGDDREGFDYVEMMTSSEYAKLCIGMPSMINTGPALYTKNTEMHKKDRVLSWLYFQDKVYGARETKFSEENFDFIIHHQIGIKTINRFQEVLTENLKMKMPEALNCLDEFANTASTSHFLVLHKHLREGKVNKGDKIFMAPAASGIVTGCISLTIGDLEV